MLKRVRRFGCLILALVLVLSLAVPALAATKKQTISSKDKAYGLTRSKSVTITSGSGLAYKLGWKKTTVTVTNTGSQTIYLYDVSASGLRYYKGALYAGCSKTLTISGSGKTARLLVQGGSYRNGNYGSFTVQTSAGSIK